MRTQKSLLHRRAAAPSAPVPPVRTARDEPPAGRLRRRLTSFGKVVLPFVILIGAWWALDVRLGGDDRVLASPPEVVGAFGRLLELGVLSESVGRSLSRLVVAIGLAMAIGVPLGFALGLSRSVAATVEPFLRFLQGVSSISWLPLAIVWYGFSDLTIYLVVTYAVLMPLVFSIMTGVRTIPTRYRDMCRSLGAGPLRVVRDVYVPGALPSGLVGLRLGIGYGWRALIAGEMVVSSEGLGVLLFDARTFHMIDQIMMGMILIGVLFLIMERLVLDPIEQLTFARWGVLRS